MSPSARKDLEKQLDMRDKKDRSKPGMVQRLLYALGLPEAVMKEYEKKSVEQATHAWVVGVADASAPRARVDKDAAALPATSIASAAAAALPAGTWDRDAGRHPSEPFSSHVNCRWASCACAFACTCADSAMLTPTLRGRPHLCEWARAHLGRCWLAPGLHHTQPVRRPLTRSCAANCLHTTGWHGAPPVGMAPGSAVWSCAVFWSRERPALAAHHR